MTTFKIDIASVPDRDDLVAEIWSGAAQVAELRTEGGAVRMELYAAPTGKAWDFPYEQFVAALQQAHEKLCADINT